MIRQFTLTLILLAACVVGWADDISQGSPLRVRQSDPITFALEYVPSCPDSVVLLSLQLDTIAIDSMSFELDTLTYLYSPTADSVQTIVVPFSLSIGDYDMHYVAYHGADTLHQGALKFTIESVMTSSETLSVEWGTEVNGVVCKADTTLVDTLVSAYGCDSIHTIQVQVGARPSVTPTSCSISFDYAACVDTAITFTLQLDSGTIDSVRFSIGERSAIYRPSADSLQSGAVNIRPLPVGAQLINAVAYQLDVAIYETSDSLDIQYPSSILYQKWNDFIGVLTKKKNGGYDFTAYQWYKNGVLMEGETEAYIYQTLEEGAEYSVLLTDSAGVSAMSCPIIAVHKRDSSAYPTVVSSRRKIRISLPQTAQVIVYDITGNQLYAQNCELGVTWLSRDFRQGIYLVAIYQDKKTKPLTYKILVQ